ncbi:hypothetical protein KO507_15540 [Gilvimarinus agarilyticus]|uniref:hypothetical protein n=1 Tax=Gilvimarinus sp. 2_MG-2023 TaxID=3062666 RepID=UPI001C0956DA|nr:hypothetical protein [Gilvimarinus sp. 2_MG-2023]MBU2887179.1 hypothetical protein [Gilvimarinus agarilyticus]MDO6571838.1 hypothetical protein [Gilvimarinus sp. 2_MG-2023]
MSTDESSLDTAQLSEKVSHLLADGGDYSFVIQADNSVAHAEQVRAILQKLGVQERHIAIARPVLS